MSIWPLYRFSEHISVFTCLSFCPPVLRLRSYAITVVRSNTTWYHTRFTVCCLTKEQTHESYSPWKGHCFAQLPSARAARGVESHRDKSEMTLKQRNEGCRLFICPRDEVGAEETQSRAGWVVPRIFAVKWSNKVRLCRLCVLATSCYSLVPPGGGRSSILWPLFCLRTKNCFLFIMSCCI